MLKTVKVKKKLRLDELIKHIFDNDIRGGHFFCCTEDTHIKVFDDGRVYSNYAFSRSDTFTVEVEEPITEDTVFEDVVRITREKEITQDKNMSINDCLDWKDYQVQIFAILDGKLQLIWEEK